MRRALDGLTPGRYGVVLLDDRDGNGRWTGVDPASRRAPEPVFLLATEVEVRAGWELEFDRLRSSTSLI